MPMLESLEPLNAHFYLSNADPPPAASDGRLGQENESRLPWNNGVVGDATLVKICTFNIVHI